MSTTKKNFKSKISAKDAKMATHSINEEVQKQPTKDPFEIEDDDDKCKPLSPFKTNKKKKMIDNSDPEINDPVVEVKPKAKKDKVELEEVSDLEEKVLALFKKQSKARKQFNEKLFNNLADIKSEYETEVNTMKENAEKLDQISGSFMKYFLQSTEAFKEKANSLDEIQASRKRFDDMESMHAEEQKKSLIKLEGDIIKLQEHLEKEQKKHSWDRFSRQMRNVMQNDV